MNAQTNAENFETAITIVEKSIPNKPDVFDINQAHALRSKFINAYAKIEIWAVKYCSLSNIKGDNLNQRIEKIRKLQCKNQEKISDLLDELRPITDFRGEFAHAVLEMNIIAGKNQILYQCPSLIGHPTTENYAHLCPEKLRDITKRLHSMANSLSGLTGLTK